MADIFSCGHAKAGHNIVWNLDKNKIKKYPACKTCSYQSHARWRKRNKEKIKRISKKWHDKTRFGGLRELVLIRDEHKCNHCDMSEQEHIDRWGRSLTVDHIDGNGRYVEKELVNNDLNNLQTLCLICHSKKDCGKRYRGNRSFNKPIRPVH